MDAHHADVGRVPARGAGAAAALCRREEARRWARRRPREWCAWTAGPTHAEAGCGAKPTAAASVRTDTEGPAPWRREALPAGVPRRGVAARALSWQIGVNKTWVYEI